MSTSDIAIRVEGLGKQYRLGEKAHYKTLRESWRDALKLARTDTTRDTIWALSDVSFEVKRGEVVGVIGRNGAGKSTLLKVLSRITRPTTGSADIHGRIGSLLEVGTGFHPELTGRENIFLNGAILGMSRIEVRSKFDEIVAFAEIEQFIDTPVKRYSSGMYVRLAFAVAAHLEPEILLIDEVLAVGDAAFQRKCLGKVRDVSQGGNTVIFVSHNMQTVESICDRGVLLNNGCVEKDGSVAEVLSVYLKGLDWGHGGVVDLLQHGGRTKSQMKILQSISIVDQEGSISGTLRSGESFGVRIGIVDQVELPKVSVGIGVEDSMGRRVFSLTSLMLTGKLVNLFKQRGLEIEFSVQDVILMPGSYYITVSLVSAQREWLDSVDRAIKFDVLPVDVYGTGKLPTSAQGCVCVPASVRIGDE